MCILRGMLGVSWTTRARLSLLSFVGIAACAGGDPGGTGINPFTTQPGNTTPGGTGESGGVESGSGEPTGSASATSGPSTDPTSAGPSSDPSGDPSGSPTTDPGTTTAPDPDCVDMDVDGYGEGCQLGPDCDDTNYNAFVMCATCVDEDTDNYWIGCDQYSPEQPGPDCDDGDAMKTDGMNCACAETPADKAADACSEGAAGKLGPVAEGGALPPVKGIITKLGGSDWYWVEFPDAPARPNSGKIVVNFANNPGDPMNPDYRFEVFRACGNTPFMGLGASFGPNTPPAREWEFWDAHVPPNPNPNPNPNYKNDVPWPTKVYIRVTRVANDGACSEYALQVARQPT
jgi:hypothetical protein